MRTLLYVIENALAVPEFTPERGMEVLDIRQTHDSGNLGGLERSRERCQRPTQIADNDLVLAPLFGTLHERQAQGIILNRIGAPARRARQRISPHLP